MTAIAVIWTEAGVVFAADGRCMCGDKILSDAEQKIFRHTYKEWDIVYAIAGDIFGEDRSTFDLLADTHAAITELAQADYETFMDYARALDRKLDASVKRAIRAGYIELLDAAQATVFLASYFPDRDERPTVAIVNVERKAQSWSRPYKFDKEPALFYGSPKIREFVDAGRPKKTHFASIQEGVELAEAYVKACYGRPAIEIDEFCKGIGGHMHIAKLTPDGCKWIKRPKSQKRRKLKAKVKKTAKRGRNRSNA